MKEITINIDSYNKDGIRTIQGNNNADIYKIYILFNKRRVDLTGKTVKMAYLRTGTNEGNIIDLNITNSTEGEITLEITNAISRKDGVYSCQLAVYDAVTGFKEHTATFGLTVEANIFNKIADEIADNKDLTYIERILEEAINTKEELKSNIPVARQLNIDLENQNRILNENMDRANEVNNTLITTTEQSKVAGTEAIQKKSELESSIVKAKKFIDGLDGSQNIPQLRLDVTKLQNGLKSNQALSYEGSSISANDTLEGRTEGMKIKGRTLQNIFPSMSSSLKLVCCTLDESTGIITSTDVNNHYINFFENNNNLYKPNTKYTVIIDVLENSLTLRDGFSPSSGFINIGNEPVESVFTRNTVMQVLIGERQTGRFVKTLTTRSDISSLTKNYGARGFINNAFASGIIKFRIMILEGELTDNIPNYFKEIKSFGESEQEGDKYRISLLSHGKNLININDIKTDSSTNVKALIEGDKLIITSNNDTPWRNAWIEYTLKGGIDYCFKYNANGNGFVKVNIRDFYDDNISYTNDINEGQYRTFRVTKDTKVRIRFFVCGSTQGSYRNEYYNIQLEYETHPTTYQPYQFNRKDILISAPLRGFDFGEDIMFEEGKVKITRNIDTYTFTGDETMRDTTDQDEKSGTGKYRVFVLTVNKSIDKNKNINNNFPKKQFSVAFQKVDSEGLAITQYGVYIKILKSKLSTQDTEGFKAWLKANQTVIYFSRATPVTEIVENCIDIDLDTFGEKTYFNILNSLPGELDFKVPSNIGSSLQNLAKEVNNIWDVINNLLVPSLIETNKNIAMATIKNNLK